MVADQRGDKSIGTLHVLPSPSLFCPSLFCPPLFCPFLAQQQQGERIASARTGDGKALRCVSRKCPLERARENLRKVLRKGLRLRWSWRGGWRGGWRETCVEASCLETCLEAQELLQLFAASSDSASFVISASLSPNRFLYSRKTRQACSPFFSFAKICPSRSNNRGANASLRSFL